MATPQIEIVVSRNGAELLRKTVPPGEYIIGQDEAADLLVDGPQIAKRHARLTVEDGEIYVEDLGSDAGTFVNGLSVKDNTRVWPSQEIRIGDATVEAHLLSAGTGAANDPAATVGGLVDQEIVVERKYEIEKILRREPEGTILDTHDSAIRRDLAMKVIKPGGSEDDVLRFVEEAQITGQLEHPGIPPIHELGTDEHGRSYYTMKVIRGVTLGKALELLHAGQTEALAKYSLRKLLAVFQKACDAIAFAHSKGVIHRDLKPESINIGDFGEVLVMDWESARRLEDQSAGPGSDPTATIGAAPYMAPEQARGELTTLDARTDIYALGAILYHILTLRPPLREEDRATALKLVGEGRTDRLDSGQRYPHLPRGCVPDPLTVIVAKAMAREPAARYASVLDFQSDLEAYHNLEITKAEQLGPIREFFHVIRRYKLVSVASAIVIATSVVFGVGAVLDAIHAQKQSARDQAVVANLRSKPPAFLKLAEYQADTQHFDEALTSIDAALAINPASPRPYWERAWALLALERWDEAAPALQVAYQRDPVGGNPAHILPAVTKMKSIAKDPQRWKNDAAHEIVQYLESAGASGPAFAIASKLAEGAEARRKLVDQHLQTLLGKGRYQLTAGRDGLVMLNLAGQPLRSLDAVRGLPIDSLDASGTAITDIDALRGLRLHSLNLTNTKVTSLAPLVGVPLHQLVIDDTKLQDLTPLKGAPLEVLSAENTRVYDLGVVKGTLLRSLNLKNTVIRDLSILRGLPLESLNLSGMAVSDLSPLQNAPLKELDLRNCRKLTNFAALLTLANLERLSCDVLPTELGALRQSKTLQTIEADAYPGEGFQGARPVAIFWSDFDAKHGGPTK